MATIAQQNTDILLSNLNKEFPSIEEGYSQRLFLSEFPVVGVGFVTPESEDVHAMIPATGAVPARIYARVGNRDTVDTDITKSQLNDRLVEEALSLNIIKATDRINKNQLKKLKSKARTVLNKLTKIFDESKSVKYPYMEQMVEHILLNQIQSIEMDTNFVTEVARECLVRIIAVQPDYRVIYGMPSVVPGKDWRS
ncbi:Hypothetical protein YALI2_A00181g [Yarrowia lipolytica]|nr:Hypothetical protein YALI2_A00181g [Yarrowia lipolytica]